MPITSLLYTDLLNSLYRENLSNMMQGAPGYVIEFLHPRFVRKHDLPADCPGCGAPTEPVRMACRYCRRRY